MFKIQESKLNGCFEIIGPKFTDERGDFRKLFSDTEFRAIAGADLTFREIFTSTSKVGVIRGLHFQRPPHDHAKLVACLKGRVMDVVVDLRKSSPTYGQHAVFDLSEEKQNIIFITRGFAHGFYSFEEPALMLYAVETVHSPAHDTGIHWNSAGIAWPIDNPIVSKRDSALTPLSEFDSPF